MLRRRAGPADLVAVDPLISSDDITTGIAKLEYEAEHPLRVPGLFVAIIGLLVPGPTTQVEQQVAPGPVVLVELDLGAVGEDDLAHPHEVADVLGENFEQRLPDRLPPQGGTPPPPRRPR